MYICHCILKLSLYNCFYPLNGSICQQHSVFLSSWIFLKWCQRRISVIRTWISTAGGKQSLCFWKWLTGGRQIARLCFAQKVYQDHFHAVVCIFFRSWLEQCVLLKSFGCRVRQLALLPAVNWVNGQLELGAVAEVVCVLFALRDLIFFHGGSDLVSQRNALQWQCL